MKFKLKQEKLQYMLEKLIVKDMFPKCTISTKNKTLLSIEQEEYGRTVRFARFKTEFFDEIDDSVESIKIDVQKILKVIKNIGSEVMLTCEVKGNKFTIKGKRHNPHFSYEDPPDDAMTELPFEIKDGVPLITDAKIALDVYFKMKPDDFKEMVTFASSFGTEFYSFSMKDKKIEVRIGDLTEMSDFDPFTPDATIVKGTQYKSPYTYGIQQVADTFDQTIHIKSKSECPAWMYEATKKYILGVLVPPYEEDEE